MASTNKTTNYELSQYVGTDKPTYLGDYNGDMLKIDTGMKENADAISGISNDLATVSSTANAASSNASSALSAATTASTTATTALNKATANETKIENFNLSVFETITTFTRASGSGTIITNQSSIQTARNTDGSLAKIYGVIFVEPVTNGGNITFNTSLRPAETITINGGCLKVNAYNGVVSTVTGVSYTIGTDGTVTVAYAWAKTSNEYCRLIFNNSLLFIKDFGDTPLPE